MSGSPERAYTKAKEKYDAAKTTTERLAALQEMLSASPKHKGAEKQLKTIKKKIAETKKELLSDRVQAKKSASAPEFSVKKEGDAQIVLVGFPNIGKSTLLSKITNAKPEIANYEFTTLIPNVGVMEADGAKIQIVDLPGLIEGASIGKGKARALLAVVRTSDAVAMVATLERDPVKQLKKMLEELRGARIYVNEEKPRIEVRPNNAGGVIVDGASKCTASVQSIKQLCQNMGFANASLMIMQECTLEDVAKALDPGSVFKKAVCILTKKDVASYDESDVLKLNEFTREQVISISKDEDLTSVKDKIFNALDLIRVYTKRPDEEADMTDPLVVKKGTTVIQACKEIHKDLAKNFKYAKLWGSSKFPGQRVSPEHVLREGDVLEVHQK